VADLLHQASDDQLALAICVGAVAICGLVMHFSHHVGRMTGHIRLHSTGGEIPLAISREAQTAAAATVMHEKAA
jgi:hypothetical protein